MFAAIKEALGTEILQSTGQGGGGCISEGEVFKTDKGKIFLKRNSKSKAHEMFVGEFESLKAIAATGSVKVPEPHLCLDNPAGGAVLVMEYIDMHGMNRHLQTLGLQLARLHLHNIETLKSCNSSHVGGNKDCDPVTQFGFHVPTSCGYLPQNNSWTDDWVVFYARKLEEQLTWIDKEYGDRQARELWSKLQLKIPQYFKDIDVKPSLLHGDLWSGNAAETSDGPVIFDPASFYGHHEYDLGIAGMFGGFSRKFWDGYFNVLPKQPRWRERHRLYQLFHNLNHWNHFGNGYRSGSLQLMQELC